SVEINVLQGERPMAGDNKSLGRFILDGIPPAPRGVPQIDVTFDIDANGILNVTAQDKATSRSQHITIQGSSGLSKEEVERMRKEAEAHAAEDKARLEKVEAHNQAEAAIHAAEKGLKDGGDKVPADVKSDVESKITAVRQALEKDDVAASRKATEALYQSVQAIGSAMYQQESQAAGQEEAPGPDGSGAAGEDVVEGEFKEA
ncbi:MAG: Hsp70 family protein, partial [Chloroflexi bacterium]|nr:Hsp70 family protein [Chloroflexota bacterium]